MANKLEIDKNGLVNANFQPVQFIPPSSGNIVMDVTNGSTGIGDSISIGSRATAFGANATATDDSIAFGCNAIAGYYGGNYSIAIGNGAIAYWSNCYAIGDSATSGDAVVDDLDCITIGASANATMQSIAIGYGASATNYSIACGAYASADYGSTGVGGVAIGAHTTAENGGDFALGYYSKSERPGELVHSADCAAIQQNSWSMIGWYGTTTDATATEIFIIGSSRLTLMNSSAFMVTVHVVGFDNTNSCAKGWRIETIIGRNASAATTTMATVGSEDYAVGGGTTGSWTAVLSADTTNGSLIVTVTGATGVTVKWTARADFVEVRS